MKSYSLFLGLLILALLGGVAVSARQAHAQTQDVPASGDLPNHSGNGGTTNSPGTNGGSTVGSNGPTQGPTEPLPALQNPLKAKNVTDLLFSLVDILIFLGVIVAVFMFVFIGFKFVMAQGNSDALKEARQWFLYAVIGTAILISSKVIVEGIKNTLTSAGVVNENLFNKSL
jgi:hypothetical protein